MAIVKGAGMIMKAIIEEGTAELASRMQELALSEGALPRHLHISMFTQSIDTRLLTMRQLSRNLVSLWCADNHLAISMLERILPAGLLGFLESSEQVPKDRDLMQIRDNLKLAIEQNPDKSRFRANVPQKILNAQSVKVIEKQINNVLQHWKQRVSSTKADVDFILYFFKVIKYLIIFFFSLMNEFWCYEDADNVLKAAKIGNYFITSFILIMRYQI
jgi:DnaJ family protein C protein 13